MVSRSGTTNRNQRKVTTSIEWYQHNMVQLNQIAKNMELVTRRDACSDDDRATGVSRSAM